MKRDMDLIKRILTIIEKSDKEELSMVDDFKSTGASRDMLEYTFGLLKDNSYIDKFKWYDKEPEIGKICSGNTDYHVGQLTWKGHDLLESLKQKDGKTKNK